MLNIPDKPDVKLERFIHGYAKLMASWGMPLTAARVCAYVMLQAKPVGLDQIADGLGISKASAWAATRHLDQVGQIDRFGEAGSKRALYASVGDFSRSLRNYSRLLSKSGGLILEGAALAEGEARSRMEEQAEFYLAIHEVIEAAMQDLVAVRKLAAAE